MELIVRNNGEETRVEVETQGTTYLVRLRGREFSVDSVATNGAVRSLVIEGQQFEVAVRSEGVGRYQISHQGSIDEVEVLDPLTYLVEQTSARRGEAGAHKVTAYMPGRVVEVLVEEGEQVRAGQGLVVLEAMKMENEIQAEHDAVVGRVFVSAGQAVEGGDPLFELE